MRSATVLVALALAAAAATAPAAHAASAPQLDAGVRGGDRPRATRSIVSGRPAAAGEFPSAVAVLDSRRPGEADFDDQFCGGSLLAPTVVLTAAHCVTESDSSLSEPGVKRVVIGRTDLRAAGGEEIAVAAIDRHPLYDDHRLHYDVALLKLAAPSTAPLAQIGDARTHLREGQAGTAVGWGLTSEDGVGSPSLLKVNVPLWSNRRCSRAYRGDHEPGLMLCAASRRGGRDVCNGDSGGPLMVRVGGVLKIMGIVSFGRGCAVPGIPTTFAWAASPHLRDWIVRRALALDRGDVDHSAPLVTALRSEGNVVRYSLSEPASVVFTLRRRLGRRLVTLSTALVHAGRAGTNGFRMPRSLRGRRLARGSYRIRAFATDQAGNLSAPARTSLRVR